jgi:hypothetical protein
MYLERPNLLAAGMVFYMGQVRDAVTGQKYWLAPHVAITRDCIVYGHIVPAR